MPFDFSRKRKPFKKKDDDSSQNGISDRLDTVRWVFVIIFAIVLFANGLHFSSIFMAVAVLFMIPVKIFKTLLERIEISAVAAVIISFALLAIGVLLSPIIEEKESLPANHDYLSQTSSSIGSTGTSDSVGGNTNEDKNDASTNNSTSSNTTTNSGTVDSTPSNDKNDTNDDETDSSGGNTGGAPTVPEGNAKGNYLVTFDAELIENKSVGSEWETGIKFNDTIVFSEDVITFDREGKLILTAYAIEDDDATDDYGSEEVEFSSLAVGMEETLTVRVVVFENNKNTSTKTATWEFVITVKRLS